MKYLYKDKIWVHGSTDEFRKWLHWGNAIWSYEGYLGKNASHNSMGIHIGGEENDLMIHAGIKRLFNFYARVENFLPRKWMRPFGFGGRIYGISAFDDYISIEFHRDDMGMSGGWRGYHKMIDWKTIVFGKQECNKKLIGRTVGFVKLPEGYYESAIECYQATWTRKRFKKPHTITRYDIKPYIPIPEPGKGENGWDIDDDAVHEATIQAESLNEALEKLAQSVMKTRRKRAGEGWEPNGGFTVG